MNIITCENFTTTPIFIENHAHFALMILVGQHFVKKQGKERAVSQLDSATDRNSGQIMREGGALAFEV